MIKHDEGVKVICERVDESEDEDEELEESGRDCDCGCHN
jgi:hypothetical protein